MSRPVPSVLLAASDPPPRRSSYLPTASPVASTSSVPYSAEPTLHCSQCQKDRPVTEFPVRLINLQPYLVCFAHEWYWTDAKRALHWAPEQTTSLEQVRDAFVAIARHGGEYDDRFMLEGDEPDLDRIVNTLARAGDWKIKKITPRKSRAKSLRNDPPTTRTFLYGFRDRTDPKVVNRFTLTIYFHPNDRKYTMTFKPEAAKDRSDRAWARPNRNKEQRVENEKKCRTDRTVPHPRPLAAPNGQLDSQASGPASAPNAAISRAQSDAQQMPPPPIPPRKKARRVEPSLVSPSPNRAPPASGTLPEYAGDFSALPGPLARLQQHTYPLDGPVPTLPNPPRYPSHGSSLATGDPKLASSAVSNSPSLNRFFSTDSLTLFEMLANPAFDPPIIPLLPRPPRPTPLSRREMLPQTQTTPSVSGKDLDDAVADALGGRRRKNRRTNSSRRSDSVDRGQELEVDISGEEEEERNEVDRVGHHVDRGDEGDYEDSIPDDSSQEDEETPDGRVADEEDDVSSFFESSAEEYSEFGESGDEEDEEDEDEEEEGDEEEDWLAGFVSKQMPGMAVNAQEQEEPTTEARGRPEEAAGQSDQTIEHTSNSKNKLRSRAKEGPVAGDEDEVDELESSDGE